LLQRWHGAAWRDLGVPSMREPSPAALYDHPRSRLLQAEQRAATHTAAASAAWRGRGATITTAAQLRARHREANTALATKHRKEIKRSMPSKQDGERRPPQLSRPTRDGPGYIRNT
jgi:hypothetical protein